MTLARTVVPATEPLSTDDAKTHLRVSGAADDAYIAGLVSAARVWVENHTGQSLIDQTWQLTLDRFPGRIYLPRGPVSAVSSVGYVDGAGASQEVTPGDYVLDGNWLRRGYNVTWPTTRSQPAAVTVTYVAGYGALATAVPADFVHAVRLLVGHWYENREPVLNGAVTSKIALTLEAILSSYITV